jgi:hypothetical protein
MCGCNGGASATPTMTRRAVDDARQAQTSSPQAAQAAMAASVTIYEVHRNGVAIGGRRYTSLIRANEMAARLGGSVVALDPAYA